MNLTDEDLNIIEKTCDVNRDRLLAMVAEIRQHRAAMLTAEDIESLKFARSSMLDDRQHKCADMNPFREEMWGAKWDEAIKVFYKIFQANK